MDNLRGNISAIYYLVDLVSELDVIQSLAVTSSARSYVKPTFAHYTEIEEGIHPLLEHLETTRPVPNTFVSIFNFHIKTDDLADN